MNELKTLIIEDNQGLATNIGEYLEAHNHIVDFADNGLSGFDRALNDDFDTIVLDINLPGLNDRSYPKAAVQNRAVEIPHRMTGSRPKAVIRVLQS